MDNNVQNFINSLSGNVRLEAKRNGARDESCLTDDAREVLGFSQPATLYRYRGGYYIPELGLESDSLSGISLKITEWYCSNLLDSYSTKYRNGVRTMTLDQLEEFEQSEYLVGLEANGLSGSNPGYYLYWITYPDGTEEGIDVKPEYE